MKKIILILLSFTLLTSCLKEDLPKDYTEENEQEILAYLADNNLSATKTSSGLYYIIDEPGTGLQPTYENADVATVAYKGSFTNGTVFDESDDDGIMVSLRQVIYGWAEGIPFFKEGGKGQLIIPSRLGYGSSNNNDIPGGSVLVFDIELLSVNFNKENNEEITKYLDDNNLTDVAVKTDSGLYYIIEEEPETGEYPTATDDITISYKGYYTDNSEFNSSTSYSENLNNLIQGWKEGIPYFKEGGKGKLFIPSRLAYGNYNYNAIPGGSVLIFDIELISID